MINQSGELFSLAGGRNILSHESEHSKAKEGSSKAQDDDFLSILSEFTLSENEKQALLPLFEDALFPHDEVDKVQQGSEVSLTSFNRANNIQKKLNAEFVVNGQIIANEKATENNKVNISDSTSESKQNNTSSTAKGSFVSTLPMQKFNPIFLKKLMAKDLQSITNDGKQRLASINPLLKTEDNAMHKEIEPVSQLVTTFGAQNFALANKSGALQVHSSPFTLSEHEMATESLSERVGIMLAKNLKHADIRLDPPELGRLHIKLAINQDSAAVQFTVTNQMIREVIEQSLPRLREMFQQHGLQMSQSSVQQEESNQHGFAGDNTQQQKQPKHSHAAIAWQNSEDESKAMKLSLTLHQTSEGVDYYA